MGKALFVTLVVCTLLDLSLLVTLGPAPRFTLACHALLSGIVFIGLWFSKELRNRPGFTTFSFLALLFCILAPFIGFLGIGILLMALRKAEPEDNSGDRFVIGNPMREAGFFRVPSSTDCRIPIVELLGQESFDEVVEGVAYLKGVYADKSISLLRRVRDRSNAMASLHANAALAILSDQNETILATARNHHRDVGNSLENCYLLGSAYQLQAMSGSIAEEEKESPLLLAMENYINYPDDLPSLIGMMECGIELESDETTSRILNLLEHLPHGKSVRENLRRRVLALQGEWSALQESVTTYGFQDDVVPRGVQNFWEEPIRK